MLRRLILAALVLGALPLASANAQVAIGVTVGGPYARGCCYRPVHRACFRPGFGILIRPAPVVIAPAPVYLVPAPTAVMVQPAPTLVAPVPQN